MNDDSFKSGREYERKLIKDAILKEMDEHYEDLERMRKELETIDYNSLDAALLEEDAASTFLYIAGLNGALHIIKIMENNERNISNQ